MFPNKKQETIYLAGGFRSGWQLKVIEMLPEFDFLDPSAHKIQDPALYTKWDLDAIRKSDVILAYMESSNPAGYALSLEIGFAHALGKEVILVDQIEDAEISRYFEMIRQCSNKIFDAMPEAIQHLQSRCHKKTQA